MPELELYITNRPNATGAKDVSRRMFQYRDLEFTHGVSDARTLTFKAPIYDINGLGQSNVSHLKLPYRRFAQVFYLGHLIFWGPIVFPAFNGKEGMVEINCVGGAVPWLRKHHFHPGDDALAGVGYTGDGLAALFAAAQLTASEAAAGYAPLLLVDGALEAMDPLLDADANEVLYIPEVGANVWDAGEELTDTAAGPDFDILPIDEDHDPDGAWAAAPAGAKPICQLNTYEEMGQDRSDHIFHFNYGRTNLENLIYAPDGNLVTNRFVAQDEQNAALIKVAKHAGELEDVGILEGWETPIGELTETGLETYARHQVRTYAKPLETVTVEPVWDQGRMGSAASTPWRYPTGYYMGDTIRGFGRKGNLTVDLLGRLMEITLSQVTPNENVRTALELVPQVADVDVAVDDEA